MNPALSDAVALNLLICPFTDARFDVSRNVHSPASVGENRKRICSPSKKAGTRNVLNDGERISAHRSTLL